MNLAHGGHLTHGHPLNFSGKLYTIVPYGVRKDDERIDYDELERLADEHKPKMIIVGASAYPRVIDFARIRAAADRVGAPVFTDMAHIAGLVAAGVHPSPVPHADFVTTTTHKTLRGPRGGMVLCREQYAKDLDRTVFPGVQGGPLMHIIAAKAVCFKEAARAGVRRLPEADRRQRRSASPRVLTDAGLPPRQRRHRQSPDARRRVLEGHHRQGRRGGARQGRHHGQQERDPVRSESADGRERHPHRHAGGDHARHARSGDGPDRRAHRARARRRRTTIARSRMVARSRRRCAGSSRCTRNAGEPDDGGRRRRSRARRRRSRAALDRASSRAPARSTMAAAVARVFERRRRPARRSGHRHRQDARLSRARDPQPRARADLDRHQEPAGADLLQGHSGAARRARHPVHRDLHEGPRELPVRAQARSARRRRRPGGPRRLPADHPRVVDAAPRPAIAPSSQDLPEDLAVLARRLGDRRHLPRHRVPALRRLLRHADAPARRRRPTWSSSTITCCAPTRRSGRTRSAR